MFTVYVHTPPTVTLEPESLFSGREIQDRCVWGEAVALLAHEQLCLQLRGGWYSKESAETGVCSIATARRSSYRPPLLGVGCLASKVATAL